MADALIGWGGLMTGLAALTGVLLKATKEKRKKVRHDRATDHLNAALQISDREMARLYKAIEWYQAQEARCRELVRIKEEQRESLQSQVWRAQRETEEALRRIEEMEHKKP